MSDQNEYPSILDGQGLLQETHEEELYEMETDAIDSPRREEPRTNSRKRHYDERNNRKGPRSRRHNSKERPYKKARHARHRSCHRGKN